MLFRDTTKTWVEDPGPPYFLKDGSFLFFSERSGWKHLYHLTGDGKLKRAVTRGEWEIHDLYDVDEENGWVYFSSTRDSPIEASPALTDAHRGPICATRRPPLLRWRVLDPVSPS